MLRVATLLSAAALLSADADNLAEFELCPSSAAGQAICNSALDLKTNTFTASCDVEACSGADCTATVVNKVTVDEDECFNAEKGATGIVTIDGEAKCGCASDDADNFSPCQAPANGRALCVATDADFLGSSPNDVATVECSYQCDDGYFLTPGGSCIKFAKRAHIGTSAPIKVHPTTPGSHGSSTQPHATTSTSYSRHPHNAHTTSHSPSEPTATTTTWTYKHFSHTRPHHSGSSSSPSHPSASSSTGHHGSSKPHHPSGHKTSHHPHHAHPTSSPNMPHDSTTTYPYGHHGHSTRPHHGSSMPPHHGASSSTTYPYGHHGHSTRPHHGSSTATTSPGHPTTTSSHGPSMSHGPSPSQLARRTTEEFVFSDLCAQDERTCAVGSYGDFSCVRLDDVTECGGCNASGDAVNCLEIVGASSVSCLRGGCVVRSCQTGFVQTSEGTCEPKA
ncbi:hypothetical protein JCM8208_003070 [Rhodotorula glutinis]